MNGSEEYQTFPMPCGLPVCTLLPPCFIIDAMRGIADYPAIFAMPISARYGRGQLLQSRERRHIRLARTLIPALRMANNNASIEELTASLQELTAQSYGTCAQPVAGPVDVGELQIPAEVETFVENSRAYAERTRNVSEGTY